MIDGRSSTIVASRNQCWQRSTLPDPCGPSTIDPEELNCRVRNGNGCDLFGIATSIRSSKFFYEKFCNVHRWSIIDHRLRKKEKSSVLRISAFINTAKLHDRLV